MKNIRIRNTDIGEGLPKICVGFFGEDFELAEQMYRRVKDEPADILEWRVDYLLGQAYRDVEKINELIEKIHEEDDRPIILTLRTEDEGVGVDTPEDAVRVAAILQDRLNRNAR